MSDDRLATSAVSIYKGLFRNPAAIIFLILGFAIYSIIAISFFSSRSINLLEVIKAAPFAFSALIVGIFSVLFWALNYIGKQQKVDLRVNEAAQLFKIRREAIDAIFDDQSIQPGLDLAVLKAHLLMSASEVSGEPETPPSSFALDYGDAVKAILRKS